ncbi:hypothetical protein CEXT_401761 [Caerostris extrusa]|uniref:Uncharacterized protein n=1 Tax=Caerostris extrusa TaxID=172846 RepID=A0AAV4NTS6_CAEEX|nr:hypothetical protein CEXT_401761 [Caerostris extrusa]
MNKHWFVVDSIFTMQRRDISTCLWSLQAEQTTSFSYDFSFTVCKNIRMRRLADVQCIARLFSQLSYTLAELFIFQQPAKILLYMHNYLPCVHKKSAIFIM